MNAGPGAKVQEVENPELAQLLQQREAAYVAAFMALKQWEVVQAACLDVDQKGKSGTLLIVCTQSNNHCRLVSTEHGAIEGLVLMAGKFCLQVSYQQPACASPSYHILICLMAVPSVTLAATVF